MTKKEIKRAFVSKALTVLENNFNIEVDGGGRTIKFLVKVNDKFEGGCIGRDDLEVMLDNTINLYRPEDFDPEYVKQHKDCVEVENQMNDLLKELKEEYGKARNFS